MVGWLANEPLCTRHCSGPTAYGCAPDGVTADSVAILVCPTPCQPCAVARPHDCVSVAGSPTPLSTARSAPKPATSASGYAVLAAASNGSEPASAVTR